MCFENKVIDLMQKKYIQLDDEKQFYECINKSKSRIINELYDEFISSQVNYDVDKFQKVANCWYSDCASEDDINIFLINNEINMFIRDLIKWRRNLESNNLSFDNCINNIRRYN